MSEKAMTIETGVDLETIRLVPGVHASPQDGACVVELASIVAGEEFNDRPACACPVIAAFLRGWNDRAAYAERQRLRPYAKLIVGSRADGKTTRERRRLCLGWAGGRAVGAGPRSFWRGLTMRARVAVYIGLVPALRMNEGAGEYAARVAFSSGDHDGAFRLLDTLLTSGEQASDRSPEAVEEAGERRPLGPGAVGWPLPVGVDGDGRAAPEAIVRRRSHQDEARCHGPRTRFAADAEAGAPEDEDEDQGARVIRDEGYWQLPMKWNGRQ